MEKIEKKKNEKKHLDKSKKIRVIINFWLNNITQKHHFSILLVRTMIKHLHVLRQLSSIKRGNSKNIILYLYSNNNKEIIIIISPWNK